MRNTIPLNERKSMIARSKRIDDPLAACGCRLEKRAAQRLAEKDAKMAAILTIDRPGSQMIYREVADIARMAMGQQGRGRK